MSADQYTPTTEDVREHWSMVKGWMVDPYARTRHDELEDAFDRWLAAHDAEVARARGRDEIVWNEACKALAWCFDNGPERDALPYLIEHNPYLPKEAKDRAMTADDNTLERAKDSAWIEYQREYGYLTKPVEPDTGADFSRGFDDGWAAHDAEVALAQAEKAPIAVPAGKAEDTVTTAYHDMIVLAAQREIHRLEALVAGKAEAPDEVAHYYKRGAQFAYCGRLRRDVKVGYDDWSKVTCAACLAHPAAPAVLGEAQSETPKPPQCVAFKRDDNGYPWVCGLPSNHGSAHEWSPDR